MDRLAKNSFMQAAALGAVWMVASSFAGQTPTAKIETRHPDMAVAQAFDVLEQAGQVDPSARHQAGAGKGDLGKPNCTGQAWPYIAAECLVGTPRQASRTITIEKRTGETASTLIRVSADQRMASR